MRILHFSDIHFRKTEIGTTQDPNFHLRSELFHDVVDQSQKLGAPDAIIITGDIAFAGDPAEFEFATQWLQSLCDACGCSMQSVFVVPGNHDAVRKLADENLVQLIHKQIQGSADPASELSKYLADTTSKSLLYQSLDNFNQFAGQFFCDLLPPNRTRATRDLVLNDGSTLRLWGINTAVLSSSRDVKGSLVVDQASFQITRERGVVNMVIAHHHLSWLHQGAELADHLNHVAPVQVFGHIHTNRIDLNRDYMRLTASATHPDRGEAGWEPGYNFLELCVVGEPNQRKLHLKAHVRVWQTAPSGFQSKRDRDASVFEHFIALESWQAPPTSAAPVSPIDASILGSGSTGLKIGQGQSMNNVRALGLRFYQLSFSKKSEIAGRLNLLEEEDMGQPDHERFRRVLIRAHERGQLEDLAQAVLAAEKE
ncbi:metallophosphoesterase [Pseudomonas putida]|uniref:metallophosphoesterase n=2 Tax=Pseudomonas TaxID=286 RepID=UPI0002EC480B|nr:metallophosphoesterase [Pseudomonas putida]